MFNFIKSYFAPSVLPPSPTAFTDLYIMWAISTITVVLIYQKRKEKTFIDLEIKHERDLWNMW